MSPTKKQRWVGAKIEDLETPSLALDAGVSERNVERMAAFFAGKPCQLRPHFKNHKCTTLARRQLEAGAAAGITCAKLGEAEVLVKHGFGDVLIANQVVGRRKVARLAELARGARLSVAADDAGQIEMLSSAAAAAGVTLGVLVEVDIGMGRCGVTPGNRALELAQLIDRSSSLEFRGLQAFEGHLVYVGDMEERSQRTRESIARAIETRWLIEERGLEVPVVSGGSTSTYAITGVIDGVDELQAGTYPTMDWRYHELTPEFEVALSVVTRVISRRPGKAVLDVGVKGVGGEFGEPRILGYPDIEIPYFLSEEHLIVEKAPAWNVGEPLQLIPSHACTTCNLYRDLYVHDGGRIVDVWPIEASGLLW